MIGNFTDQQTEALLEWVSNAFRIDVNPQFGSLECCTEYFNEKNKNSLGLTSDDLQDGLLLLQILKDA